MVPAWVAQRDKLGSPSRSRMKTIEDAIALAAQAHRGQKDKAGCPYIFHPFRLMLSMTSEAEQMAAVLHDVVEDTDVTLDDLQSQGYPAEVVESVALLTHADGVPYMEYVEAIKPHELARAVKIADLKDNMNLSRIAQPTAKDLARIEKYQKALELLTN